MLIDRTTRPKVTALTMTHSIKTESELLQYQPAGEEDIPAVLLNQMSTFLLLVRFSH